MKEYELFKKSVADRDSKDVWIQTKVSDVKTKDLKDGEISCNEFLSQDFPSALATSAEALKKYAVDEKVGCYLEIEGKDYPFDDTCLTLLAGLAQAGGFITLLNKKAGQIPVSPEVRAQVLNLATGCFTGSGEKGGKEVQFLLRDEHLCTALGTHYKRYPFSSFLNTAEDALSKLGTTEFCTGEISEDFDQAVFQIRNAELEKKISEALNIPNATLMVRIASGDTGGCAVSVYPLVKAGGDESLFGEPMKIEHDSPRLTDENVKSNLSSVFAKAQATAELVANLKTIPVKHPDGMFLRLAKAAGLPKKEAFTLAEFLVKKASPTQFDVWWGLFQLLNAWKRGNQKPSASAIVAKEEAVFRLITKSKGRFDSEDAPFTWESGKID